MELKQPVVEMVIQLTMITEEMNCKGEPLYRCGSSDCLYTKQALTEVFEKSNANIQLQYDGKTIWKFYKDPDIRIQMIQHDIIYGGVRVRYEIEERPGATTKSQLSKTHDHKCDAVWIDDKGRIR